MKKRNLLLTLILVLLFTTITGCSGTSDDLQKECLSSIKEGLEARWDVTRTDTTALQEDKDMLEKAINTELDAIKTYSDTDFEDDTFESIIKDYINALQSQADAMEYYLTDNKKHNDLYNEKGFNVRQSCINKLVSDYGLTVDEEYSNDLSTLMESTPVKRTDFGETVEAESELGNVSICIDKADIVAKYDPEESISFVDEGTKIVGIKAVIKNISYNDEYNGNGIDVNNFMYVITDEGITAPTWTYGDQYGGYDAAAAGFFDCSQGSVVKVALPYVVDEDCELIEVCILPGYTMMVQID